ncbi:MAG: MFS transporter [Pseudonocardia sediminis]
MSNSERRAPHPTAVLVIVSSAAFLSSLDLFIVNIAFPDIRADFPGSDLGALSWVLNGYTVVFAAFLALAGRMADRFGHRRVFLIGLAVFTLASAACAAAPSVGTLVAARAVQAIGAAMVVPTSLSLLLAAYPAEHRGRAVGMWASIGAVAAALGPPIGGLLVAASWRWVFLVNLPVAAAALIAGALLLRESDRARIGVPDVAGAVGLVAGVGALAWALVRAPEAGWTDPLTLGALVLSVAALAWVVRRSRRHPVPALDLDVLRVPAIALSGLAMLVFTAGFAAMLFVNVLYLTGAWAYSEQRAGLALAAGPLVVVVVARGSGWLVGRFGIGAVAATGGLAFALGPLWWALRLGPEPDYLFGMLPGQLLTGLGVGLILPSLSGVVGAALPARQWGSGSSLINTARQVGAVLGIALLVLVLGTAGGTGTDIPAMRDSWLLLVATGVLTALLAGALAVTGRAVGRAAGSADPVPAASDA